MSEDLLDYWQRMISPFFPAHAWIASRLSGSDHLMLIDWKLENKPHRQSTRSRKIEIIIKEEVIDDYLNKNKEERVSYENKMKEWISRQYRYYCLDREADTSSSNSPVKWRISKATLSQ